MLILDQLVKGYSKFCLFHSYRKDISCLFSFNVFARRVLQIAYRSEVCLRLTKMAFKRFLFHVSRSVCVYLTSTYRSFKSIDFVFWRLLWHVVDQGGALVVQRIG